ncbi:hypothetical protein GGR56DRAFT_692054 [Xylariaceae sp. FL0804]|nr:hypothetical protein GGR56DRAFT_692054 [Xylariaceae sp. FL0804]
MAMVLHKKTETSPTKIKSETAAKTETSPTKNKSKTVAERERANRLRNGEGVKATSPCIKCTNKPDRCLVPTDPVAFNGFKCAHCIGNKSACSFSHDNPGISYSAATMESTQAWSAIKKAGRRKAVTTLQANRKTSSGSDHELTTQPGGKKTRKGKVTPQETADVSPDEQANRKSSSGSGSKSPPKPKEGKTTKTKATPQEIPDIGPEEQANRESNSNSSNTSPPQLILKERKPRKKKATPQESTSPDVPLEKQAVLPELRPAEAKAEAAQHGGPPVSPEDMEAAETLMQMRYPGWNRENWEEKHLAPQLAPQLERKRTPLPSAPSSRRTTPAPAPAGAEPPTRTKQ